MIVEAHSVPDDDDDDDDDNDSEYDENDDDDDDANEVHSVPVLCLSQSITHKSTTLQAYVYKCY